MIRITRPVCPYPDALEKGNYKHAINKEALCQANYDKCMYCESKISHIDYAHIEHIKPKAGGKYPELTYTWNNLGYSCAKCNNAKGEKYNEDTPYINPYSEIPGEYIFAVGAFLFPKGGSERGQITIEDIELDRDELIEKRQTRIKEIITAINACYRTKNKTLRDNALNALRKEMSVDKEYSLIVEAVINQAGTT